MEKYKEFSDEELVEKAQRGNEEGEEALIRRYADVIRRKSRLYFMVGADLDDVFQEGMIGFIKAMRNYEKGKEANFRTFAELCVNRQILSAIKVSNRLKHLPLNTSVSLDFDSEEIVGTGENENLISRKTNPEFLLILKEAFQEINQDAKNFSKMENEILQLYLQGYSYGYISNVTGHSPKTVDNAIQRVRKKLQKNMSKG